MPLTFDPGWGPAIEPLLPFLASRPVAKVHDIRTRRENMAELFALIFKDLHAPEGLVQESFTIPSYDGSEITILHSYLSTNSPTSSPTPAILHAHGGGMVAGSPALLAKSIAATVAGHGVPTFSVDYRKAPEHPHPTPTEDVYATLLHLHAHAAALNIDPTRIALFGESAGGGIAAGVALMARDRALSPPPARLVLVYPMLDDRNNTPIPAIEPFAVWNNDANVTGWTALLGADKAGRPDADVSPYAAPARAKSLAGLPRTYVDVGELDIFKAESIEFVRRIAAEDGPVEFHLYPGVPHVFELLAPDLWVTKMALANRARALTDF